MHNKLIFIIIIVMIAGGVWYGLSQNSAPPPLLTTTTTPDGSPVVQGQSSDQEIIGTLLALRAVTLSGTIFSEPSFASLQDFGTAIIAEPVGRQNPFAPLSAPSVRTATTTSSSGTQGPASR